MKLWLKLLVGAVIALLIVVVIAPTLVSKEYIKQTLAEQVKAAAARFAASDKVRVISMYPPLKTAAREPQPLRWSS